MKDESVSNITKEIIGYGDDVRRFDGSLDCNLLIRCQTGDLYAGDVVDGEIHGRGTCVSANSRMDGEAFQRGKLVYQGEFQHGMFHGEGVLTKIGSGVYKGMFCEGLMHGEGVYISNEGMMFECHFNLGVPNGHGCLRTKDGSVYNGNFHGSGDHITLPNGTVIMCDGLLGSKQKRFKPNDTQTEAQNLQTEKDNNNRLLLLKDDSFCAGGTTYCGDLHSHGTLKNLMVGKLYEGEINHGSPHGRGVEISKEGSIYEGEYRKGQYHGQGTLATSKGEIYVGGFEFGKRCGNGKMISLNSGFYEGEFRNDKPNGRGTCYAIDGTICQGFFRNGALHGRGILVHPNGSFYEGEFRNNLPHGFGILKMYGNDLYKGEFCKGNLHGYGVLTETEHEYTYEGEFKQGEVCGKGVMKLSNGDMYTGIFDHGISHNGTMKLADGADLRPNISNRANKKSKHRKKRNRRLKKAVTKSSQLNAPCGSRSKGDGDDTKTTIKTPVHVSNSNDGKRHLADWLLKMSAIVLEFKQKVRQGKFKLHHPILLKPKSLVSTVTIRNPHLASNDIRPNVNPEKICTRRGGAGASVVTVGVESAFRTHTRRALLPKPNHSVVAGVTSDDLYKMLSMEKKLHNRSERRLTAKECNFVRSHPKVFRYGNGRSLKVDLHSLFDDDDGIRMSLKVVQSILHTTIVELKLTDKHENVRAVEIDVITGKGSQVLYTRVKRFFEDWASKGCSSVTRRNIKCR